MKYRCGHEGCDICGARECGSYAFPLQLEHHGKYKEWWNDFLRRYEPWNWEILISPDGLADALADFLEGRQ